MKKILLIGAGRSSSTLFGYLKDLCSKDFCILTVLSKEFPDYILKQAKGVEIFKCDVSSDALLGEKIKESALVISMLPANMHIEIAKQCIEYQVHFLSASYVSEEMKKLDQDAVKNKVLLLNECGLDPGLDHMSAMHIIDGIRKEGGEIVGFESFAGGLVATKFDNNPWNYKLTWNPRNVVLAGQGGVAKFKESGTYKYIPYQQLFRRTEMIKIPGHGRFEGYANRDSLKYGSLYNLDNIQTLYRGTLRRPGFCKAWSKLVELGMTDDSYRIPDSHLLTKRAFTNLFLAYHPTDRVELKFQRHLQIAQDDFDLMEKMNYLGLFSDEPITINNGTPAEILQSIIEPKWKLDQADKDMVVMWHKFTYLLNGKMNEVHSSLVVEGENQVETAMAKTVGLPMAIAAKLILQGKISISGVQIPVLKQVYEPILGELKADYDIYFTEEKIT